MKVWMVIGVYYDGECSWSENLKCFGNESDAITFRNEYDSNPDIIRYKALYRKWMYGGEEIYDDENSEDCVVIGYEHSLTEEERKEYESLTYEKRKEYETYESCSLEEHDVL